MSKTTETMATPPLTRDEVIAFLEGRGWVWTGTEGATCVYEREDPDGDMDIVDVSGDGYGDSQRRHSEAIGLALACDGVSDATLRTAYVRAELAAKRGAR